MLQEYERLVTNDSFDIGFFARELEYIKTQTYDVKYPQLKATILLPVSSEAGPGAITITYDQFDKVGFAKIVTNYATDFPRVGITGKQITAKIKGIGDSYAYNIDEIRAAQMAGRPLTNRLALAARRANDQEVNRIAWFGDAIHDLQGLFNNPNIPTITVPNDGEGSDTKWSSKTPDQIIRDMNLVANSILDDTNGVESPDTLLLPIEQYTYIASTPRSSVSDTTILQYFLTNNPFINKVDWLIELKGSGTAGADQMFAYRNDPMILTLEIPQPFEQFPVQQNHQEYFVDVYSRCGGVLVYYPLSCKFAEGI